MAGRKDTHTTAADRVILAVSVGNNVTKLGIFAGKELLETWVVTTPAMLTESEAKSTLMEFLASVEYDRGSTPDPEDGIIASVVPELTDVWMRAIERQHGRRPLVVGPGLKTGLRMGYHDPAELGADRVADAIGARALFGSPLVVINIETLTTIEVIDKDGAFLGGVIAPGTATSSRDLANQAAKIPEIRIEEPKHVIGTSTEEAVRSGVVFGEVALIDGLVEMIWDELGYETPVVVAGAGAKLVESLSLHARKSVDNLTLRGLVEIYYTNRKR